MYEMGIYYTTTMRAGRLFAVVDDDAFVGVGLALAVNVGLSAARHPLNKHDAKQGHQKQAQNALGNEGDQFFQHGISFSFG